MISKGIQRGFFTGGASFEQIERIEQVLNVRLPKSYKWFLTHYGHGGFGGVEIFGVAKSNILSCVEATEYFRSFNTPKSYVVIENLDEWVHCLDTSKIDKNNEDCPVVDWDRAGKTYKVFNSFEEFLIDRFGDALENIENE